MKTRRSFLLFTFPLFFYVHGLQAENMQVVYSADSLSGEALVTKAQYVSAEECVWTLKLPAASTVKVTRMNNANFGNCSGKLLVDGVQEILAHKPIGEYSTMVNHARELNFVLEAGHDTLLFDGPDPIILIRFVKVSALSGNETVLLGGDLELTDGIVRASGRQEIRGTKIAAILGGNYDTYTCFGAPTGGRIRGSDEGYLMLEGNPNGYGRSTVYINRYVPGDILMTSSVGKVGIGVESPQEKLHVAGAIRGDGKDGAVRVKTKHGQVSIGAQDGTGVHFSTLLPAFKFDQDVDVKGCIRSTEVKIEDISNFPDYVFDASYRLRPLSEVNSFIQANGHLPEIPPATEVEANGMNMAEMQMKLLQKIEELTLYVIEQQKEIQSLKEELEQMK